MHLPSILLAFATGAALTAAYPASISQEVSCSTESGSGQCKNTASGCSGGAFVADACPGDSNVQCCVKHKASSPSPTHSQKLLKPTKTHSPTKRQSHTPKASHTKHPKKSPSRTASHAPTSTSSSLAAVDISTAKSSTFWSCLAQSKQKVVIRGYQQACGVGGAVDKNFVKSYNAAKAAGISKIDAYLFPCTGTQPTGVTCKSPEAQLSEFEAAISGTGMDLDYVWFDVEPTSGTCNGWKLAKADNLALAKQWTALLRQSSLNWGIYGNGNQWTAMFPSRSSDIGSDLPLWAVQDNHKPGVSSVTTFMGGWTKAVGSSIVSVAVCGSGVDLDSFTV